MNTGFWDVKLMLDNDKLERIAASKFKLAQALADAGKVQKAKERCEEIIKKYPKTDGAKEAKEFLEKLDK